MEDLTREKVKAEVIKVMDEWFKDLISEEGGNKGLEDYMADYVLSLKKEV